MNLKNMFYYYIHDNKRVLTIYYGIIIAVYLLFIVTNTLFYGDGSIGGMEMSTVIFLFVVGLNSFKANFHFGLANGASRKTQFLSYAVYVIILGVFAAIIDMVIANLVSLIIPDNINSLYISFYGERYSGFASQLTFMNHVQIIIEQFLWFTSLYSMATMLGYCITLIYYRCNIIMKWIVSIIPFIFFFIVLPYIDRVTQGAAISRFITNFIPKLLGFIGQTINPYIAVMTFIIAYIIFGSFSYLLIRRAVIKQ